MNRPLVACFGIIFEVGTSNTLVPAIDYSSISMTNTTNHPTDC